MDRPEQINDPERALSLAYAPARARAALALLWRLDEQFGQIVATTATLAVGQMRLTWWHNALEQLGTGPAPAEPLLRDMAAEPAIDPHGLLPLVDGWEALLEPLPLTPDQIALHGEARGAALFRAAANVLGANRDVAAAGRLWALTDLGYRISDAATAARALEAARAELDRVPRSWPRPLRPLAVLAGLARRDAGRAGRLRRPGSPARVALALRIGLFGV
jgi:phytoene synthase